MISRRSLLATGAMVGTATAAIAGAAALGRLDDLADLARIKPRPEADPGDVVRLSAAADEVAALEARVRATAASHPRLAPSLEPVRTICAEHLAAVSGSTVAMPPVPSPARRAASTLADRFEASAKRRSTDAFAAAAPEVALLLASMTASHRQCARIVRGVT